MAFNSRLSEVFQKHLISFINQLTMIKNVFVLIFMTLISLNASSQDFTDSRQYFSFLENAKYATVATAVSSEQEFNYDINTNYCPVVVMFTATWCGPCKMIFPFYCSLPSKYPAAAFIYVDTDRLEEVAKGQGITTLPTFKMYKNGQVLGSLVGADCVKLELMIQSNINR